MKPNVMLDLETMSLNPAAAIIAIGAVKFDPLAEPGTLLDEPGVDNAFRINVDLESAMQMGLRVDAATIEWWMHQSDAARKGMLLEAKPLEVALAEFHAWYGTDSLPTWCNGTDFDLVVMKTAYMVGGWGTTPWKYSDARDYRTIRKVFESWFPGVQYDPPVLAHDAFYDALAQATHLQKLMRALTKYHSTTKEQ